MNPTTLQSLVTTECRAINIPGANLGVIIETLDGRTTAQPPTSGTTTSGAGSTTGSLRNASPGVHDALVAAAVAAHDISGPQGSCTVAFVSTVDRGWASLGFPDHPSPSCQKYMANGIALFHYTGGSWHFVTAGSAFRCPIPGVPSQVAHDLVGGKYGSC